MRGENAANHLAWGASFRWSLDLYILRQEKRKPNNVAASSRTNAKAYRLRKTNKEWKKSNGNDVFRRRRTSMSEYLIVKKQKLEPAVEQ